jgi:hypothetical protein
LQKLQPFGACCTNEPYSATCGSQVPCAKTFVKRGGVPASGTGGDCSAWSISASRPCFQCNRRTCQTPSEIRMQSATAVAKNADRIFLSDN